MSMVGEGIVRIFDFDEPILSLWHECRIRSRHIYQIS